MVAGPTNILTYTFACLAMLLFHSCYVDLDDGRIGCERGKGSRVTEQRNLPAFNQVTNAIGANIVLRQDLDQEIFLETKPGTQVNTPITGSGRVFDAN